MTFHKLFSYIYGYSSTYVELTAERIITYGYDNTIDYIYYLNEIKC